MTSASPTPSRPPAASGPTRRALFRGGAGLVIVAAAGSAVSACTVGPSEAEITAALLAPLARTADVQRRQAEQLAPRETSYTAALTQIAKERGEHARALLDEINRLHAPAAAQASAAPTEDDETVTLDAFGKALSTAARDAADAAATSSGFVAGLLASISASCATLKEVQLA
ncbi:MAG: hypothetical protein QM809_15455 [Gordonia sp. (in: high G+C Gram-positive bacteria)]|uniref:hypothetical protein n=1 Tax=Gordonia sp. (in: high G+C Gram-positive bacteria) TaxID=84139 RepID=UPI0039E72204